MENNNKIQDNYPHCSKHVLANRFNIVFFEFSFLVEACIPPRPIARANDRKPDTWKHILIERFPAKCTKQSTRPRKG